MAFDPGTDDVRIRYVLTARDLASRQVAEVNRRMRRDLGGLRDSYRDVDRETKNVERDTNTMGRTMRSARRDIDQHARSIDQLGQRIRNLNSALPQVRLGLGTLALAFGPGLVGVIGQAVGLIGNLAAGLTALAAGVAPVVGAFAAFAPAFAGVIAVMATLTISTKDLSQALGGNAQALKRLTPEARAFLRELQPLRKEFDALKRSTQGALFGGLTAAIQRAQPRQLLRTARAGLTQTATTIGDTANQAAGFIGTPEFRRDVTQTFRDIQPLLRQVVPAMIDLFRAFVNVEHAAQPLAHWFGQLIDQGSRWLAVWTKARGETGRLAELFDRTRSTISILGRTAGSFGRGFLQIFNQAFPLGHRMLQDFLGQANRFNEWTRSLRGREEIADYFRRSARPVYEALRLVRDLGGAILQLGTQPQIGQTLNILRTQAAPALRDVLLQTSKFGPALAQAFSDLLRLLTTAAGPIGALQSFTEVIDDAVKGLDWMMRNIPGVSNVLSGLTLAFGALAGLRMIGLITGLARVRFLMTEINRAGGAQAAVGGFLGGLTGRTTRTVAALEAEAAVARTAAVGPAAVARGAPTIIMPPGRINPRTIAGIEAQAAMRGGQTAAASLTPVPTTLLGRFGGLSRGLRVGGGLGVGALALGALAPMVIPGRAGRTIAGIGGGALTGATLGAAFGPEGVAIGAAGGALAGLVASLGSGRHHVDVFAQALTQAAAAAHDARNALSVISQTRRDAPVFRAQVQEAQIGVRQALTQRRQVTTRLETSIARQMGIPGGFEGATAAQRREIEAQVRSTDAWKQATDQVVFAQHTLIDSTRQLAQNTRTQRQAVELQHDTYLKYAATVRHVGDATNDQIKSVRQAGVEEGLLTQAQADGRAEVERGSRAWTALREAHDLTSRALNRYRDELDRLAHLARTQGKPALANMADAAKYLSQQLGRVPTSHEIHVYMRIHGGSELQRLVDQVHSLRAQGQGGAATRIQAMVHHTGMDRPNMAFGGRVLGPRVAADNVHAMLSPGEFVVTGSGEQLLEAITGIPGILDALEQVQKPHFQEGGRVRQIFGGAMRGLTRAVRQIPNWDVNATPTKGFVDYFRGALAALLGGGIGGEVNTSGLVGQVKRALGWARAHGWHGQVTSGVRSYSQQAALYARYLAGGNIAAAPGTSSHEFGQAVDVTDIAGFGAAMRNAPANARLFNLVPGDPVHFSVSGHRRGGRIGFQAGGRIPYVQAGRPANVYAGLNRFGLRVPQINVRGLAPGALMAGIQAGQTPFSGQSGILSQILGLGVFQMPQRTASSSPVATASGARALGQQMAAAAGWHGAEWTALDKLWTGESHWDPNARNRTSGAYGIPQALPATKMAIAGADWRRNAATQIRWGLAYIRQRYGSPVQAYRAWLSRSPHWYRRGGRVGYQAGGRIAYPYASGSAAYNASVRSYFNTGQGAFATAVGAVGAPGGDAGVVGRARAAVSRIAALADSATIGRLNEMAVEIEQQIRAAIHGGANRTRAGRLGVQRLRAALSVVDYNIGEWIGGRLKQVQDIQDATARVIGARGRGRRRAGIDDASVQGINAQVNDLFTQRDAQDREMATLRQAMAEARRRRDAQAVSQIQDQIDTLADAIDETTTQIVEGQRAAIQAAAQHAVTMAAHGVAMAGGRASLSDSISNLATYIGVAASNAAAAALGIDASAAGIAGSPEQLRARAALLTGEVIPALQRQLVAQTSMLGTIPHAVGGRVGARVGGVPILVGEGGHDEYVLSTDPQMRGRSMGLLGQYLRQIGRGFVGGGVIRAALAEDPNAFDGYSIVYNSAASSAMSPQFDLVPSGPASVMPAPTSYAPTGTITTTTQEQAASLQEQIQQTQQQIIDALAEAAKLIRDSAEQAAQALSDAADRGARMAELQSNALQLQQQLAGVSGTPGGFATQADFVRTQILTAVQVQVDALRHQIEVAQQEGDTDLVNQLQEALGGQQNQALQVQLQIRDLLEQAASASVAQAGNQTALANLAFQGFQLRQRLGGTFDTGGLERAGFIQAQVIPSLTAELNALTNQLQVAQQQNDAQMVVQTLQEIAGKQNELLQASLDVQTETQTAAEAAAASLRDFGGSAAFQFGGQTWTDLIGVGVGV